jgi:hypothetical protein
MESFPYKALCMFDFKGQVRFLVVCTVFCWSLSAALKMWQKKKKTYFFCKGMRTDVVLAKGGEVITVNSHGEEGGEKGYDAAWAMCEVGGKEGWLPRRYLTALSRAACADCRCTFGPQNRARTCHECSRTVCSMCGESFLLKV